MSHSFVDVFLGLPVFHAEWVFWLLVGVSIASLAVVIERALFFQSRRVDLDLMKGVVAAGEHDAIRNEEAMEARVVCALLSSAQRGRRSLEDLASAVMTEEKRAYDARVSVLATVAANAPFVGLLGTVLGIIRAFKDLSANVAEASTSVMAGVAEALVATAIGLFVAIPAVIAYNVFKARVRAATTNSQILVRLILSRAEDK